MPLLHVQWNVSYPNMSGLNPVHNYEYSVSLKLNTQHTMLSFLGSLQMTFSEPQRKQGHK